MKIKGVVSVVLLLFVAASVAYLIVNESRSRRETDQAGPKAAELQASPEQSQAEPTQPPRKLVAYYFHRTQRCHTCLTMEAYAQNILREDFLYAFESGELEWRAVNVEEPEHEHFVKEYGLTASALVMVFIENGEAQQWKNLDRVWELVRDEWAFKEYVRSEALAYLEGGS